MKYFYEAKTEMELNIRHNINFPSHLHEQFEIGYIENGSASLLLDENEYQLNEGDFFVVFPNQIHGYSKSKNLTAKMFIFPPQLIGDYKKLFSAKIPANPVVSDTADAQGLAELIFNTDTDNINVLKGFLLALFGILTDKMILKDIEEYNVSTLKNILIYCLEHYTESITISDVSTALHISRYHIAHLFRKKLNTTFSDYIAQKRIDYACKLLSDKGLTVTAIAYQSGFNSLRSFNRNFLKLQGVSPKEYRKKGL